MEDSKKYHRLSMNTSLKNARIFDDDAWEEGEDGVQIKKEIHESDDEPMDHKQSAKEQLKGVKKENIVVDQKGKNSIIDNNIEAELEESYLDHIESKNNLTSFKNEYIENYTKDKCMEIDTKNIKKEHEERLKISPNCFSATTPLKKTSPNFSKLEKIKEEPTADVFNESPFNRELFKNFKIKEQTPVKEELTSSNDSSDLREELNKKRSTRKSVKRTIFTRNSPYKRDTEIQTDTEKRMTAKSRLGPKLDDSNPIPQKRTRQPKEVESDPEVLARRQKQIDYGKNTSGYDSYVSTVPRHERKLGDPQTPDKYSKYSRRGWEGLIRQWRIKLHKYDPVAS